MTVGSINLSQIWLQISKYQYQLFLLVVVLLVLYLLAFAADLTWRLLPNGESGNQVEQIGASAKAENSSGSARINLAKLKKLNLFGDLDAKEVVEQQEVTSAPETRLNLILSGVVATNDPAMAAAIIENRGLQNTYGINDEIDGTNAELVEVFADRVIIKNGPRRETLMLDGVDFSNNGPVDSSEQSSGGMKITRDMVREMPRPRQASVRSVPKEVIESTKELRSNPAGFTDFISISRHVKSGQIIGFKISPGKKPSLFKKAGFVAGDIVTEINGLDLTDPQQALEALAEIREAPFLQLTIDRGEELLTFDLDFPDPEEEQDI